MVFFTCNSCGESLKKNKVDKHLSQCRSDSVSCVDCGKDFTYDYNNHNQCLSEDQKYGGLDYKPKDNSTKGKTKQEEWVQVKGLLTRLSGYDNIPRKKPKFFNFVRSCLHVQNEYYTQQMWDVFENAIKTNGNNTQNNETQNEVQNETNNAIKRHSNHTEMSAKKLKNTHNSDENHTKEENGEEISGSQNLTEDINGTQSSEPESNGAKPKLKIRKIVVQILEESQNNTLSLKKLKKKVIKKYKSMDDSLSKEDIASKLFSKLNKIKKIEMNDNMVTLRDQ